MRLSRPLLSEWVVAASGGLWVAAFLAPATEWALAIAPVAGVVMLWLRQAPATGALLLATLHLATVALGVPAENPAGLVPAFVALYTLGRHARVIRGSVTAILYLAAIVAWDFAVPTLLFAVFVMGGTFAFGRVVRHRSSSAGRARAAALRLENLDAACLTAEVVADERARLGGQTLDVIRHSVEEMKRDASAAAADLDPVVVRRIAERGRAAVAELRWLLGLLRTEPEPAATTAPNRRRRWLTDAAITLVMLALSVVDGQIAVEPLSPIGWLLLLALPTTLLIRRIRPAIACLAAAAIVALMLVAGSPLLVGVGFAALLTLALLAWSAAIDGSPLAWAGLALLTGAALARLGALDPANVPITFMLLALPAFAGHEWGARDRAGRLAEARASALRAALDSHIDRAVRAERLRLARDLHDVTSHAVGVMVLQASAAQALLASNPDAARSALRTVEVAGAQALSELDVLFDILDAGAIGGPGLTRPAPETLDELVERMRAIGLQVTLQSAPVDPDLGETVYRIVQEALTNVARHAHASTVRVRVGVVGGAVEVAVTNDGPTELVDAADTGTGFGLAGLAERVRGVGGGFTAAPLPSGGYGVFARLPVMRRVPSGMS
ncbi:sensor histidine kinase [Homoserinimonas sp. A447]